MRYLAVDWGEKRLGLALSDAEGGVALPWKTLNIESGRDLSEALLEAAQESGAGTIILGLPLDLEGRERVSARKVRALGQALEAQGDLPIVYWDERCTTVAAERALRPLSLGKRKREVVDQVAATMLLQSYLRAKEGESWERDVHEQDSEAAAVEAELSLLHPPPRAKRGRKTRRSS